MDSPHQQCAPLTTEPKGILKDLPPKTLTSETPRPLGQPLGGAIMAHDEHKPVQEFLDEALIRGKDDYACSRLGHSAG